MALVYYCRCCFPVDQQEGKAIAGAVGRLRDHEDATKEAETDEEEKEKGPQRAAKVSFLQIFPRAPF